MKKSIRGKAFIAFAVAIFSQNVNAQNEQENLKKYWNYRDRYVKQFVKLGWQQGNGINCINIDPNPANEGVNVAGGNAFPNINPQFGYRKWADAMTNQGNYIAVLASQYKLLKEAGKDVTATLNELYYAINAVDRLDGYAEQYIQWGEPINYNGFFIRDDVHQSIAVEFNNQYAITEDPRDRYEAIQSNYFSDAVLNPTLEQRCDNEMSQDAVILLLQGFTFVKKMVGHVYVKPSSFDTGFYLDDKVKQITERIMNLITQTHTRNGFTYELFNIPTSLVGTISSFISPNGSTPGNIPSVSMNTVCDVQENWILMNPVTNQPTGYFNGQQKSELRPWSYPMALSAGYITGNDYVNTKPIKHKSVDIIGDGEVCLVPHDITVQLSTVNSVFWNMMQNLNWSPGTVEFPQICIPMTTIPSPAGTLTVPGVCFDNLRFNNSGLDRKYNAYYTLVYASITGTWSHTNVNNLANNWGMQIYDLMYAVLNNTTPVHPKSYWENLLSTAPCQGPYNYKDGASVNFDNDWFSTDRFGGNTDPYSVSAHGEFNGNDYMLLYNLYQLAYKTSGTLPEYDDVSCPCEQSKEFSQKIKNYMTLSTFPPSGTASLSMPVTVGRKFSDYTNFDVKIKEYLIQSLDVMNNINLKVETDLVVCNNSTLRAVNNGIVYVGNTASLPSSIIVRAGSTLRIASNGTLKVYDKSKVIIEKGGTLYIEPNAEIQLLGNDAVLDIQGNVYIEPNAEFTFTYPGANSGYVRFSQPGFVAPPYTQVSGGAGSKINFVGQSDTDKVLEIDQDILYVSINNGISEFNIEKGNIYFTGSKAVHYISTDVPTTFHKCLFNGLRGHVAVWGQPVCDIRNCKFNGINIVGNLFAMGNNLKVIGTEIYNTTEGIYTQGKGVSFINLNSHNNYTGWRASLMNHNSYISNSKFNNNDEQGVWISSSPIELGFTNSKLNQNNRWGLEVGGPTITKLKCSEVKENVLYGFYMGKSSSLSMNIFQNGGYVDAQDNGERTIYLDEAHSIDINNGYNELRPYTSNSAADYNSVQCTNFANCPTISIEGRLKQPAGMNVIAENNKWQPTNSMPLQSYGKDKFTRVISTFTPTATIPNVNFTASSQSDKAACGTFDSYCPTCPQDILKQCTDCHTINTDDFTNTKSNIAVKEAIEKMDSSVAGGYKDAVEMMYQVIKYPLPVMSTGDKIINAIAERQIIVALAQAIEEGQITVSDSTLAPEAIKVLEIESDKINKAIAENIYAHVRDAVVEKALIYYMLEHRLEAHATLDSITPYLLDDDRQMVNYTKCLINKEIQLLSKQMDQVEFLRTMDECAYQKRRSMTNNTFYDEAEQSISNSSIGFSVYPNPASTNFFVEYAISETEQAQFIVYDVRGKELYKIALKGGNQKVEITDLQLSNGIYLYKIVSDKKILKQDKLTIIK